MEFWVLATVIVMLIGAVIVAVAILEPIADASDDPPPAAGSPGGPADGPTAEATAPDTSGQELENGGRDETGGLDR